MNYQSSHRILRREMQPFPGQPPADLHPLLARLLASRGVSRAEELEHCLDRLLPYHQLKGIEAATALLEQALRERWRLLIVGDFDADGATSTAVAVRALRLLGAAQVDFLVPNRFEYGYGLTPEIVAVAAAQGKSGRPDLIITVDNGIASVDGVAAAHARGIRVLVTDHHLAPAELPEAEAIVNPNQPGDPFPSKHLAGVGVIFYTLLALRTRLRESGWFSEQGIAEPNLAELLDLVALGTVADVVVLDHNNRILVAQGVARIRAGRACPGIQALCSIAKREPARLRTADLGFALGPRLNAAGRMDDMSLGIRCLLSDEPHEAMHLAQQLDSLNRERRQVEGEMREEALADLQRLHLDEALPYGLCLYNPDWHQGVIGILASRIKDRVHRPVIVFTDAGEGIIKGSARSVPGVHIRDALDAVASRHPGLLQKFGGHAMAAGMSLAAEGLETFRQAFDDEVRRHLNEEDLQGVLLSDGELSAGVADLPFAETLRHALPWGQGFPEPLFDGRFSVVSQRIVGEKHLKFRLRWPECDEQVEAIAFFVDEKLLRSEYSEVQIAYRVDVNEWNGKHSLQLLIEAIVAAS